MPLRIRSDWKHPKLSSRASFFWLGLLAAALELGYLRILRLSNLKERVETLISWVLLLGIFYLISIVLAERIFPGVLW
ncbi:MAG: hypothetical protein HYS38_01915 [Acidobacteria bacterium]|nr:hypothetical protein [Acidobacteriota bacterium]